jgi:hypothetical protein
MSLGFLCPARAVVLIELGLPRRTAIPRVIGKARVERPIAPDRKLRVVVLAESDRYGRLTRYGVTTLWWPVWVVLVIGRAAINPSPEGPFVFVHYPQRKSASNGETGAALIRHDGRFQPMPASSRRTRSPTVGPGPSSVPLWSVCGLSALFDRLRRWPPTPQNGP